MKKKDQSILVVNVLDRFDTSLYGFLAPVMSVTFFPEQNPLVRLILMYATSITSLCARPCGTLLFGTLAWRVGPMKALSYSLSGVALMTVIIGLIPSYTHIGWYAPLSLVLIRLLRGICAAGETTIAKLYIMADKDDTTALSASSLYQSSSMLGIVFASAVSTIVIGFYAHAWRICFFASGLTALFALYLRVSDMADEQSEKAAYKGYTLEHMWLLWHKKKKVLRVAAVTIFSHMTYSVPFVFMNSFVPLVTDISLSTMMTYNTALLVFDMFMIPCVGFITRRYNAQYVMTLSSLILACTIIPLFYFLLGSSLWYVLCVRMWIVTWGVIFLCPLNFWCKKLFDDSSAYFLVGMGSAVGAATLGHATTPLCLWLWYVTGCVYAPAIYMAILMMLAAYAVISSKFLSSLRYNKNFRIPLRSPCVSDIALPCPPTCPTTCPTKL